jgi:transcriptional regulator with XRE-family HTH domain
MFQDLRHLRRLHEITLEEVSQRTGLSVSLINKVEKGEKDIKNYEKRMALRRYVKNLRRRVVRV